MPLIAVIGGATITIVVRINVFVCRKKHLFVATKDVFCVCRDKTFVVTKIVIVAAPTNDTSLPSMQETFSVRW